jgi:hypothetical protein
MMPSRLIAILTVVLVVASVAVGQTDPLPSWNEGPAKKAILDFVDRVTREGGPQFVPISDRIAAFDNDGTLWCEQPVYFQAVFVRDRIAAMASQHPEWRETQPFKSILDGDRKVLAALSEQGLADLVSTTHGGMTEDDFRMLVRDWIATARHPRFKRPYTRCVYQPMLELLSYLRSRSFKTFIVSGGGIEFMRVWNEPVYGIPPEQVVGSSIRTRYELRGVKPVLILLPQINFIDKGPGKPVGISTFIGRRPIAAFGNSDDDYEMLRYVTSGSGARLGLIVHHTDAEREYAYDRDSPVGRLDHALDEAPARGWTVVNMKTDWKTVFPPESSGQGGSHAR